MRIEFYDEYGNNINNGREISSLRELPAVDSMIHYKTFLPGDREAGRDYYKEVESVRVFRVIRHDYDMQEDVNNAVKLGRIRVILKLVQTIKNPPF